jgi:hypothetical protein
VPTDSPQYHYFGRADAHGQLVLIAYVTTDVANDGTVGVSVSAGVDWTDAGRMAFRAVTALFEPMGRAEPDPSFAMVRPSFTRSSLIRTMQQHVGQKRLRSAIATPPLRQPASVTERGTYERFEQQYADRIVLLNRKTRADTRIFVPVDIDKRKMHMVVRPVDRVKDGRMAVRAAQRTISFSELNPSVRRKQIIIVDPPLDRKAKQFVVPPDHEQAAWAGVMALCSSVRNWGANDALVLQAGDPKQVLQALNRDDLASVFIDPSQRTSTLRL